MCRRVVDHVVAELVRHGVDHVFGVDGANVEDLYDALHHRRGITGVLAKHEFSAATMADGYARASGRLGVVAATSGGGSLNLLAGLGESFASRVPVLALVGQPPTDLDGRGSFQDTSGSSGSLDAVAAFSAVSRYCRRVTRACDVADALAQAITRALGGGPAVLLLPKDIQQSPIEWTQAAAVESIRRVDDPTAIVDALRRSAGPVTILAGDQVARDDARHELSALAHRLGARVAVVPDAKDVAAGAPVTGVMGHPGVPAALRQSAVRLLVGTRLPAMARAGLGEPTGVTLSVGASTPFIPSVHVHSDDLRESLCNIAEAVGDRPGAAPIDAGVLQPPVYDGPGVRYRDAVDALDAAMPDDADVVVDAGNCGAAAIHYLPVRPDGRFLVALGMGGMGYAFGAGIGACFARRRRTVVIAGDGSFFMHGLELHTAIQYRLPVTVVLFNNNAHAMCVAREGLFYGGDHGRNRFATSRLGAGLAAMFPGLPAVDVTDASTLPAALRAAFAHDGPSVVVVECSADEIPPFAPFLTTPKEATAHVAARA